MMLEVLSAVATLGGGALPLRVAGLRGWGLLPLGYVVGTSLIALSGTIQVVLGLPTDPIIAYFLVIGGATMTWAWSLLRGRDVRIAPAGSLAVLGGLIPLVGLFRAANLARVNPDSFHLVLNGSLMHSGQLDKLPAWNLEAWQVAMGSIHGVAHLHDEMYLRASTPFLALAALGCLVWCIERALATTVRGPVWWLAGLGGALLLTNHRFLYNAFYINRHAFVAAALLLVAASAWGLLRGHIASPRLLITILATTVPGLALARGETPIIAALVLLPVLATGHVHRRHRAGLLLLLGSAIMGWNLHLVLNYRSAGESASLTASAMVLLGIAMILAGIASGTGRRWFDPYPARTPQAVEALLWVGAFAIAIHAPRLVLDSAVATFHNVVLGVGAWGTSLVVLALIVVGVFLTTRDGDRVALRFPMTTFVPLAIWLAYLRAPGGLPYRDARSDSLSRMLLHFVPLAIFYIATAATAEEWRKPVRTLLSSRSSKGIPAGAEPTDPKR